MLSGGRAPSSELGPNPEYSPQLVSVDGTGREEMGWRRDADKLSMNRDRSAVNLYSVIELITD